MAVLRGVELFSPSFNLEGVEQTILLECQHLLKSSKSEPAWTFYV